MHSLFLSYVPINEPARLQGPFLRIFQIPYENSPK